MERTSEFTKPGIVWFVVINIILFQNPLLKITSLFKYTDECLMLFFAAWIATHGKKLHKSYVLMAVLMIALVYLGLLGNAFSGVSRTKAAIILDIANFAKLFVTMIGASLYFEEVDVGRTGLIRQLAAEVRLIVTAGLALAALSQVANIGMTHGVRFGIKAFQFIFSTPGMLNQYCIIYLLILTLDLRASADKRFKYPFLLITFGLWISTGRTRGFAMIAVWTVIMYLANNEVFGDRRVLSRRRNGHCQGPAPPGRGHGDAGVLPARRRLCDVWHGAGREILFTPVLPLRNEYLLGPGGRGIGTDGLLLARCGS